MTNASRAHAPEALRCAARSVELVTFDENFNPIISASDQTSLTSVVTGGVQLEVNIH